MQTRSSSKFIGEPSTNPTSTIPNRRNRRRSKQRVESFSLEENPVVTMADQRTMAELLRAPTKGYAEAIVVPPIPAEHFELKHSLINLVTSKQFFGFEKEDPHAHIRYFNKITSTLKPSTTCPSELTLRVVDVAVTFKFGQYFDDTIYNNAKSVNRIDVIDISCEEYAQEVLGFSDSSKSGNPTPSLDPILSTSFPFLTPLKEVDGLHFGRKSKLFDI
ncbi:hypothetical protein Tco_1283137 [Tanacetum coccineum]